MPCTIRPLRATDEADWRRLWTGYLEFYKTSVPEAVYASTFARLLGDDARDFNCLVAEVDGKMVGLTHYLSHRHAWKIEEVIYLQDLYVDPAVRGTGAGRALIEAVYAVADAAGTPPAAALLGRARLVLLTPTVVRIAVAAPLGDVELTGRRLRWGVAGRPLCWRWRSRCRCWCWR